jgi:hypothetical protein
MATKTVELKAALPADFSGEPADAMRWIKAIKAYLVLNASIYATDDKQVITALNKMSKGRGVAFSDMWYDQMLNPNIVSSEKTFAKFKESFESTFFPFDTQATSRYELSKLVQKSFKCPDGIYEDGFQKYITDYQNLASKAQISDERTLCDQFSVGLDIQITTMILSISSPPTMLTKWVEQAKTFHAQKMRILALKGGRTPPSSFSSNPRNDREPDTMDVDTVTLSKLTPTEHAKCIREGRCFHCRKTGYNATNCNSSRKFPSKVSPRPQTIRSTETQSPLSSTPIPPKALSPIEAYINSLKTQGKNDDEILQVLQMCYEEPKEEIAHVSTDSDF